MFPANSCCFLFFHLRSDDLLVGLAGREQFGVGAAPDDAPTFEDEDLVRVADRGDPLPDDEDGRTTGVGVEAEAQLRVRCVVEGREGVIEDVQLGKNYRTG